MTRRMLRLLGILWIIGAVSVQAQDNWFGYLYNWQAHQFVRVDAAGSATTYELGLSDQAFFSSRDIAFSADGARVAFCAVDYAANTPRATLYLRDIAAQTNLLQLDLGSSIGCQVTPAAFNQNETQLAVGLVNYFGAEDPNADLSRPIWQLRVLDLTTSNFVQELNAQSPAVSGSDMLPETAIMPMVRSFSNDTIIFAEVPYGIGGTPTVSAFSWQMSSGTLAVVPEGPWGHLSADWLHATGEVAWVAHNDTLPAAEPNGPLGFANVVILGDSSGQERMIYHTAEWTIIDVRFIEGGQRLAILLFPQLTPGTEPGAEPTRWIALDRSGNVSDLQVNTEFGGGLMAAPEGYLYLSANIVEENPDASQFTLEWYRGSQRQQLWSAQGQAWELVYSAATTTVPNLPPFPTFTLA